ncbi:MAG: trehalase family glycosidase [Candidatus Doudnabacteria bacterium]|jgi:alpha,alpha-trehalase
MNLKQEINTFLLAKRSLVKRKANGFLKHDYLVPNGPYEEQWDWDGHFIGIALAREIPSEAIYLKNWALNYLEHVQKNGFTPGLISPGGIDTRLKHVKPFLAQGASLAVWYLKDYAWLKPYWPALKRSLHFRMKVNIDKKYNLACWYDSMESGADNNPVVLGYKHNSVIACDLNTYLYSELRAMAELAKVLKHQKDFAYYTSARNKIKKAILKNLWDKQDSFFYNIDTTTGEKIKKLSFSGFMPLYRKILPQSQGRKLIQKHILNRDEFWSKYGIRSISKQEPEYNNQNIIKPHSNWQGPVWPLVNYFTFKILLNYGFNKEAKELAEKTGKLLLNDFKQTGGMHENYNAETGKPLAAPNFVSWNLLVSGMLEKAESL